MGSCNEDGKIFGTEIEFYEEIIITLLIIFLFYKRNYNSCDSGCNGQFQSKYLQH